MDKFAQDVLNRVNEKLLKLAVNADQTQNTMNITTQADPDSTVLADRGEPAKIAALETDAPNNGGNSWMPQLRPSNMPAMNIPKIRTWTSASPMGHNEITGVS